MRSMPDDDVQNPRVKIRSDSAKRFVAISLITTWIFERESKEAGE